MSVRKQGPIPIEISVLEHQQGWRKAKEKTASETAGLNFAHNKAAAEDDALAKNDTILRSIPYEHGFSPLLWRFITDVEILKKWVYLMWN